MPLGKARTHLVQKQVRTALKVQPVSVEAAGEGEGNGVVVSDEKHGASPKDEYRPLRACRLEAGRQGKRAGGRAHQ